MTYQLWDTETANMVGAFQPEVAALDLVRDAAQLHGPGYVESWALEREDDQGRVKPVAEGDSLLFWVTEGRLARFEWSSTALKR
jgi:hypothetical protein